MLRCFCHNRQESYIFLLLFDPEATTHLKLLTLTIFVNKYNATRFNSSNNNKKGFNSRRLSSLPPELLTGPERGRCACSCESVWVGWWRRAARVGGRNHRCACVGWGGNERAECASHLIEPRSANSSPSSPSVRSVLRRARGAGRRRVGASGCAQQLRLNWCESCPW